jgi:hypothetical protein
MITAHGGERKLPLTLARKIHKLLYQMSNPTSKFSTDYVFYHLHANIAVV